MLLKEEIQQVGNLSIQKQKEIQGQYYEREMKMREECEELVRKMGEMEARAAHNAGK